MDGASIRKLRKYLGANQTEFADLVGASKQSVVAWELGSAKPSRMAVNSIIRIEMDKMRLLVELACARENAAQMSAAL